jgi:pSer/pThr/pTyr-binding forkhead associated (FHA) protein
MFKLELRFENLTVKEYHLKEGEVRFVGRDPYSHIVIDDPDVSRNHAVVARSGDTVFLWDEGSKHGTMVNGCQIVCTRLRDGDIVHIGTKHTLEVRTRLPETTADRRLYHRVKVRWPTTLVTNRGTIDGIARDLSLGGVFFYYGQTDPWAPPLRADDRVAVVFNIPGHDQIQASARVAWSDILAVEEMSTVLGVGLEFVDVRHEDREYLLQAITERMFWARDDATRSRSEVTPLTTQV